MERRLIRDPALRWAIEPAQAGALRYIDGVAGVATRVPEEGEVLTLPFIVDATTGKPVAVRVVRIEYMEEPKRTVIIPVVVPAATH